MGRIQVGFDGGTWGTEYMAFGVATNADNSNPPAIERMRIVANGNVGIGTANPTHTLSVNGTIKTKEVIVETAGWADYVFSPEYDLPDLDEVEAHIKERGHLPGIPSAKEVAEKRVSVGELQAKLLAKIEELTLHLIRIEKENRELRREVQALTQ